MSKKVLSLLLVLFLCGCADGRFTRPFPIDENGPVEKSSKAEICRAKKMLAAADTNIPAQPQSKGLVVFDGTLLGAKTLPNQKQELLMEVDSILLGAEEHVPKQLKVISPTERNGGVTVAIGEKYRVAVMPIGKKYYAWAASGTAPKDPTFSGFYGCK